MKQKRPQGEEPWDGISFEDISSRSVREKPPVRRDPTPQRETERRRPGAPPQRRKGSPPPRPPSPIREFEGFEEYRELPRRPSGGPESRRNFSSSRRPSREEPQPKRRGKGKPNRLAQVLALLFMVLLTAILCIFLLFKVSNIEITGDKVYDTDRIIQIAGLKAGDNLVFLSTSDKEKRLLEELPYIGEVEIIRHFPGTLEVHITGSQVVSCVSAGNAWLYVSGSGKILEAQKEPKSGVMQVLGVSPQDITPGQSVRLQDEPAQQAYMAITGKITELEAASHFTKLDLSDLYDIRLWYEGRVLMKLGSAANLEYKVEFGWTILSEKIGAQERGTLDLSYADEGKRAGFTAGEIEDDSSSSPSSSAPGTNTSSAPEQDSSSGGRGEGIPNAPFTGESSAEGDAAGAADGDTVGENGDDTGWDTGGDTVGETGDETDWDTGDDTVGDSLWEDGGEGEE